ncbi:MAG: porin family protein [Candidatus Krumholzibacteria bacterium]|nr:porin family protein [Candidatus Krumholzibacteria bacterium]
MRAVNVGIVCLSLTVLSSGAARSSTSDEKPRSLRGKHRIELGIGLLSAVRTASEVEVGGITTSSDVQGVIWKIAYAYHVENDVAVGLSLGGLSFEATTSVSGSGVLTESASVVHLLFGVKYQPSRFALGDAARPYVSASVGPYFGSASNVRVGTTISTQSLSETALGSRLGIGVDILLGRLFTLGVGFGYHVVSDFDSRIGSEKNYSSPEFGISFGIAFGG